MSCREMIQKGIDYIESRLPDKVSIKEAADASGYSPFHFHRLFQAYVGCSAGDYIRGRRLTVASEKVLESSERLLDIALDSGFQSQEAFTRAFKSRFGTTPARYRENQKKLLLFEKSPIDMESLSHIVDGISKEPRFQEIEAFKVVGILKKSALDDYNSIHLWKRFLLAYEDIPNKTHRGTALEISGFPDESMNGDIIPETVFDTLVCTRVSEIDQLPKGFISREYPRHNYAVFSHKGSLENVGLTYEYIYKTWLPNSGMTLADSYDFELYSKEFDYEDTENLEFEIYLPVR